MLYVQGEWSEMVAYVGIDVSKSKIDLCWLRDATGKKVKTKVFKNSDFHLISQWLAKSIDMSPESVHITLEATGVYHEGLVYHLHEQGYRVFVANPGKANLFAKSHGMTHKTDKSDAKLLAKYGASEPANLHRWEPDPPEVRELKAISRRLHALEKDRQRESNRLESSQISGASLRVTDSIHAMIGTLDDEIERLKQDIDDRIKKDPVLATNHELLGSIKGIGGVMQRELVCLFARKRFCTAKQVAAYLGLIPRLWESGVLKGKTTLSKTGPSYLRAKLYMAAVAASQHNPDIKKQKNRLLAQGKSRMAALGAAMRKLVQICFGVIKNQQPYQPQAV